MVFQILEIQDWLEGGHCGSFFSFSKNLLASHGPDFFQPVGIPALKPNLDLSLTAQMTVHPIRALRYYLDKAKDLRQGLKQTVRLAYESSELEVSECFQGQGTDVHSVAVSLGFKGGVSLIKGYGLEVKLRVRLLFWTYSFCPAYCSPSVCILYYTLPYLYVYVLFKWLYTLSY